MRGERCAKIDAGTRSDAADQGFSSDDAAAQRIAMAVDELGHRMHDHVGAEIQRTGRDGRCHRQINAEQDISLAGERSQSGNIRQAQDRIARRLGVDQPCVRPDRRSHILQPGEIDGADFDAEIRQDAPCKFLRPGIADIADDQMVAGLEHRQEDGRDRGEARGGGERVLAALERRYGRSSNCRTRRIGPTGIEEGQGGEIIHAVGGKSAVAGNVGVVHRHRDIRSDRHG